VKGKEGASERIEQGEYGKERVDGIEQ